VRESIYLGKSIFGERIWPVQPVMGRVIRVIGWNGAISLRAGVAAGLSTHCGHQFLEAHKVQHAF